MKDYAPLDLDWDAVKAELGVEPKDEPVAEPENSEMEEPSALEKVRTRRGTGRINCPCRYVLFSVSEPTTT